MDAIPANHMQAQRSFMMNAATAIGLMQQTGAIVVPIGMALVGLYVRMYRFESLLFKMDAKMETQAAKMDAKMETQAAKMDQRLSAQNSKIEYMIKAFEARTDAQVKIFEAQVKILEMQLKSK